MVPLRWATASTIIRETTMNDTNLQLPAHPGEVLREWMTGNGKTITQTADLFYVRDWPLTPSRPWVRRRNPPHP